jgi:integrase/recombinase XerC
VSAPITPVKTGILTTPAPSLIAQLLDDKRSPHTRRAYAKDLRDFFRFLLGIADPTPEAVREFLQLEQVSALAVVMRYKAHLRDERGLREATVNRRLAAIKSLVRLANQLGECRFTLAGVKGDKVVRYRDTTGIPKEVYRQILAVPERETLKGKRDYAILRLLWDNALRRGEIALTQVRDLEVEGRALRIYGKGRGQQPEWVTLSRPTLEAILAWLSARGDVEEDAPLFIALDRAHFGHGLTGTAIYQMVRQVAKEAGVAKPLSPHRIRHSGITAALDATNGDVRRVQKLSRHADLNTLMIYDDNRQNVQGEVSDLLSELV